MSGSDLRGLLTTCGLALLMLVLAIVLLTGHGNFLIAGYNTMTPEEKKQWDAPAMSRFMGKILLPIALAMPLVAISGIYSQYWLTALYVALVLGLVIFAVVWMNTGRRFRK